jgi:hypothetical protein
MYIVYNGYDYFELFGIIRNYLFKLFGIFEIFGRLIVFNKVREMVVVVYLYYLYIYICICSVC